MPASSRFACAASNPACVSAAIAPDSRTASSRALRKVDGVYELLPSTAEMELIAGQKPVVTKAKKSIAQFKLREGMPIGCKVTLRRERMYEFLDRLITIAMPRIRDFRGVSAKSFDGRGNYAMGLKEQIIFPEINYDRIDTVRGMDVIVTTTARTDEEARELLKLFGFPFPIEAQEKEAA